jgi:hypothetical protein
VYSLYSPLIFILTIAAVNFVVRQGEMIANKADLFRVAELLFYKTVQFKNQDPAKNLSGLLSAHYVSMSMDIKIKTEMVAPCGMNCAICMGHLLREKNKCTGCRGGDTNKPASCIKCVILNCDL